MTTGDPQSATLSFISVMKDTDWERTELVCDAAGRRYVRKIVSATDGFGGMYRQLAACDDPRLVRIYDVTEEAGRLIVLMEYVEGPTVRQWVVAHGVPDVSSALRMVIDLCDIVGVLHSRNPPIIHRDIKPSNVIVSERGVRLIDFGIARNYDASAARDTMTWGTLGYAAPEQLGFGQSDERTDIYGLGMLLYFLVTGADPAPDVHSTLPDDSRIDAGVRQTIAKCCALDPNARYADCAELRRALCRLKPDAGLTNARRAARHARQIVVWAIFALFVYSGFTLVTDPWRWAFPTDAVLYAVGIASMMLFLFLPAALALTNPFGLFTRSGLYRRNTKLKWWITAGICMVLMTVGIAGPAAFYSDDYRAAAAMHETK